MKFEGGPEFIEVINNGFYKKIANSKLLQQMYETRRSQGRYVEPVELVEIIANLIGTIEMKEPYFEQRERRLFKKDSIPKKQVMALYAINKICSIANGGTR